MQSTRNSAPRFIIVFAAISGVVGLLMLFLREELARIFVTNYLAMTVVSLVPLFASLGALLSAYLRGDFTWQKRLYDDYVELINKESFSQISGAQLERIGMKLAELEEALKSRTRISLKQLSADERESLLSTLKTELTTVLSSDVLKQLEDKYSAQIAQDAQVGQIRKGMEATSSRLRTEIAALSRRGNLNLVIGTLTTIVAVGLLGYLVAGASINYTNVRDLLSHLVPRVSIAIFIEVFSFFFLKLYKSSLADIKYFQNELTNIEMRAVALETALLASHDTTTQPIIDQLIKTDRNPRSASVIRSDGKEGPLLEPKDLADLLDRLAKLLSLGSHK